MHLRPLEYLSDSDMPRSAIAYGVIHDTDGSVGVAGRTARWTNVGMSNTHGGQGRTPSAVTCILTDASATIARHADGIRYGCWLCGCGLRVHGGRWLDPPSGAGQLSACPHKDGDRVDEPECRKLLPSRCLGDQSLER